MLKFSEIRSQERKQRYRWLFAYPHALVFSIMMTAEMSYHWMTSFFTVMIIIELFVFGLLDNRYPYHFSHFFLDTLILIGINALTVLIVMPVLSAYISNIDNLDGYWVHLAHSALSYLLVNIGWFFYTFIESNVTSQTVNWKWKLTGFVGNEKNKINGIEPFNASDLYKEINVKA